MKAEGKWDDYITQKEAELQAALDQLEGKLTAWRDDPEARRTWLNELVDKRMYTYSLSNYMLIS